MNWSGKIQRFWISNKRSLMIMLSISMQFLFSSILWNYFMINYHIVLETDLLATGSNNVLTSNQNILTTQNDILRYNFLRIKLLL